MGVPQAIPPRSPVIVPMIEPADPRLLLVVARDQSGIEGCDLRLDRRPLLAAIFVFGWTCLEASLVGIRSRVADVLVAIGLGKKQPQADAACRVGIWGIEPLGSRHGDSQID